MENTVLGIFTALLLLCVFLGQPVLVALAAGLVLFSGYALKKGFRPADVLKMWRDGIRTTKNVLLTFIIIGFLTGLWRDCGTIPAIISLAAGLIHPSVIVLLTFLLCCVLSFLMGTAFGTAATMGLICMTIANSMGVNPLLTSGAVLSGSMFGDRCSPVSTSALLTAEITRTDLYRNIRNMAHSAAVPFMLSCAVYAAAGLFAGAGESRVDVRTLFAAHFDVSWPVLLPAAAILLLAALRTPVKKTLLISLGISAVCSALFQKRSAAQILACMLTGFHAESADLARVLDGGGLTSMIRVIAIVLMASCYGGIFDRTDLLSGLRSNLQRIAGRHSQYLAVLAAGILSAAISCNQTLAIMLTEELCAPFAKDPERFALDLEDTVVLIAAMIPWSIAFTAQITFMSGPDTAAVLPFAVYLYFVPLWRLVSDYAARWRRARQKQGFDSVSEND